MAVAFCDGVRGLAQFHDLGDVLEELAVVRTVEVVRGEPVGHPAPGPWVEHDAAQEGEFGFCGVRRLAQVLTEGDCLTASWEERDASNFQGEPGFGVRR